MLMLVSEVGGVGSGGIQMVNKLIMDVAQQTKTHGCVVSLHDPPDVSWARQWPGSVCARGSKLWCTLGAVRHRGFARGSFIFVTHVGLAPVGRLVKHLSGGKLYFFLHGVEAWRAMSPPVSWGLQASDLFVSNSNYTLDRFREQHPDLRAVPGKVCYLPARPLQAGPARSTPSRMDKDHLRVLIVGRLWGRGVQKGQRELIALWPQILQRFPGTELWIVGDGDGRAELEDMARTRQVAEAVRFTGVVSDEELEAIYATSDVYAMPSRGEGFGLVFAEAMAHGLPCIASRHDAGSEVVVDGETGIHVDPERSVELIQALDRLLSDEALRRSMGQAGQRRAAGLFSIQGFNERMGRILNGD
jgi:phosphatidylinositol alpha-1,6-mannosyltransferase